jgi:hypothetical protein
MYNPIIIIYAINNTIGVAQIPTKYKIPTIYHANIRLNKISESPKSKATYSRAHNQLRNGGPTNIQLKTYALQKSKSLVR